MSTCRVFSCVVGSGCLLWAVHSLVKILLAFALLHFVLQGKFACYSRCFLTSSFCILVPYNEKDIVLGVLVLKGFVDLHRIIQLQLRQCYWSGHRLGLPWYWMVCLGNEQRSFCHFWDCIQVPNPVVEYDGYSISSEGFLPTVVDIMVIWVKFTHSSPYKFTDS